MIWSCMAGSISLVLWLIVLHGRWALSEQSRLFESESSWQQYRKLLPPRRPASLNARMHVVQKEAGAQECKCSKMTLMLDLDKTCLFGNDSNDLGLSLQWMNKSPEVVRDLHKLLVSPYLRHTYNDYVGRGDVAVVDDHAPQLLQYTSCITGEVLNLRYAPGMHDAGNQVHIPASLRSPEAVFARYSGPDLDGDETHDVLKSLERLLATRDAIAHELGLSTPPHLVVTAEKDVELTTRHLGMDPCSAVLYDDNIAIVHKKDVVDASTMTHECCCFAVLILNAYLCFRQWRYVSELIRQESARDDYHMMQDVDDKRVSQILRPVRSSRPRSSSLPVVSSFREADAQEARQTLPSADRGKERQRTNEFHDAGIVCSSLQTPMWCRKANSDSPASCSNLATSPHRYIEDQVETVEDDQVESSNRQEELISLVHRIHHDGKARNFPRRPSQDSTLSHNLNNAARENELAGDVFSRYEQWLPFNSNSSLRGTSGSSKRVSSGSRYTAQLLRRRSCLQ